jgi:hypothetical protein
MQHPAWKFANKYASIKGTMPRITPLCIFKEIAAVGIN